MTWSTIIDLYTTLPSNVTNVAEGSFVGKISSEGDAIDALYFKAEAKALSIRMDDITDRRFFRQQSGTWVQQCCK